MNPPTTQPSISPDQVDKVLREADLLCTPDEVRSAYDRIAAAITETFGSDSNPLILAVPIGGLFPAAEIISRLDFALEVDYIHATRYRGDTTGHDLHFLARPRISLAGRTVIVIDDILDEGPTLAGILDFCEKSSAHRVYSAVLAEKIHDRKPTIQHADFTGLTVEDRYVFGCGMDYKGYLRNVQGIYAVKGL
uniref:Hypoxanthine phosphoribosyltransferase n=1 Tax=Candidatus Kentrum sp. TUN TaxID=2126343 RepID=A0A451A745_9GAMM|nr:MAG: hypoxanthine phosphoribosyltransferase [Candidatus Kentron sp. TUN]VFK61857.1 MAG: hypoxanthine phosphoribosyltransferase [Candidatus Kentron sp. TUN]VFK70481.1 MAG: hypoxanthine phosphoribosyltransferase [Candidatus Kentron sp. TUN]